MYQIGLFSKINRITAKTLRHYDEIGLLKPDSVDPSTGYRYYTSKQLPLLTRILALKQLGLSLEEIGQVLREPDSIRAFLMLKEKELEESIRREQQRLLQVKTCIQNLKGENSMNYNAVVKSLPGCIVASMRTTAPSYDAYFEIIPPMGEEMKRQGAVCSLPEYCFTIYHDGEFKEKDIDIEVCEAVEAFCEDSDMVQYKRILAVPQAVCILHKGPYSTLREAYLFIFKWIEDNGFEPSAPPRESYIDGIWNKDDEKDWLTELQVPVKKADA